MYKKIWIESITICLVQVTTLVCYPGLILQTTLDITDNDSWMLAIVIACFTISEVIGRFMTIPFKKSPNRWVIVSLSILRIGLIYTSIMIGLDRKPRDIFGEDWFKLTNACMIGFGNGLLGTFLMILNPT